MLFSLKISVIHFQVRYFNLCLKTASYSIRERERGREREGEREGERGRERGERERTNKRRQRINNDMIEGNEKKKTTLLVAGDNILQNTQRMMYKWHLFVLELTLKDKTSHT